MKILIVVVFIALAGCKTKHESSPTKEVDSVEYLVDGQYISEFTPKGNSGYVCIKSYHGLHCIPAGVDD